MQCIIFVDEDVLLKVIRGEQVEVSSIVALTSRGAVVCPIEIHTKFTSAGLSEAAHAGAHVRKNIVFEYVRFQKTLFIIVTV